MFRKRTILALICGLFSFFFFVNALLLTRANFFRFENDKTASEKLGEISLPAYAYTMCFVWVKFLFKTASSWAKRKVRQTVFNFVYSYSYQIFATKRLRDIVQNFLDANQRTQISTPFPSSFPRFCWIALLVCMGLGITENAMFDLQSLRKAGDNLFLIFSKRYSLCVLTLFIQSD